MRFFPTDRTLLLSPAELLAMDEALLECCEEKGGPGFITFWEAKTYFVVLGYGKHVGEEVFEEACAEESMPILRRVSGGGTVLQGPGCLNYSLILPIENRAELETISGANCYIMQRMHRAIAPLLAGKVSVQGHTDLTLGGLKFSGNAQRRKRRCLLFHGSFLLNFDLALISRTLRLPQQQPEYRSNRGHEEFLTNVRLDAQVVRSAILREWQPGEEVSGEGIKAIETSARELAATKYSKEEWNRRW